MFSIDWQKRLQPPFSQPLKTVFFGTPAFSLPTLQYIAHEPILQLQAVVSQPARQAGRGQKQQDPDVAAWAKQQGMVVLQPNQLREIEHQLTTWQPDLIIVIAYGKILPTWLLMLPRVAPLNLHASLLPKFRGASPIQSAILTGQQQTGVTLMGMVPALDAGPILLQHSIDITNEMNAGVLHDRLATLSAKVLEDGLKRLLAAKLFAVEQNEQAVTFTQKIDVSQTWLDWQQPATQIRQVILAMAPKPGARTLFRGKMLKILAAKVAFVPQQSLVTKSLGQIWYGDNKEVFVMCGQQTILELLSVQLEGRRIMSPQDFLRSEHTTAQQLPCLGV